ncbi:3-deoxy-7-phosphoheptulonate synthase [Clostridiales Family XIII bacterium PM5-7]
MKNKTLLVSREHRSENTIVRCGKNNQVEFGGNTPQIIAGPCAVESREQILRIARNVQKCGATLLRGGAFKPRTSPYSFQGLGELGLQYLLEAKEQTGLPVVSEIMDVSQIDLFENVDILQVGARSMQNFQLLKSLGQLNKPILLKRGFQNTVDEFLLCAEYLMSHGNRKIILCERGIRSFDPLMPFSLDISVVPLLKEKTHLPIIVDPSHATANSKLVVPMARAALLVGADGVMVETHDKPEDALCDGDNAIGYEELKSITMNKRET